MVGTASADISFDLDSLDYNSIRSGKKVNSASKEEFEQLQVGLEFGLRKSTPLKLRHPLKSI